METETPAFHPAKRRKFLRHRPQPPPDQTEPVSQLEQDEQDEQDAVTGSRHQSTARSAGTGSGEPDEQNPVISDILRFRKSHKARRGGIAFTTSNKAENDEKQPESALAQAEQGGEDSRLLGISDRFTGHTGQKVDVDKHMMAYIETEMAKRHLRNKSEDETEPAVDDDGTARRSPEMKLPQRQPAALGKLHEIDLGPDTKLRNIARTEAATRRLAGDEDTPPGEEGNGSRKSRPENDEKRWRNRKRRNSEDLRRDQLVDEVLRESKLDVYEEPETAQAEDGEAADDRIAEQFRRDFLDAIQSRRRGARAKNTKANKTDAPRGPKLGGSRSARAAMREKQNKEAQK